MAATNEKKPMSTNQRKSMTEWQQQTGSVTERDEYVFEQGFWTDVTVIVGPERKTFDCHGLYLAKCSPVFASMLYCEFGMKSEIVLPDISARTFSHILKYVYSPEEDFDLRDPSDASALLQAAQKYELHSTLAELCEALSYSGFVHISDLCSGVEIKTCNNFSIIGAPPKKTKVSWQQSCLLMVDRDKHILQEKLWTDCSFCIGDTEVFQCHKLILAKTSPAFAAMLSHSSEHKIPDITATAFSHFLNYAYTGSLGVDLIEFVNSGEVWDLLDFADKFLLPERLSNQLKAWVFSQIYTDSFWDILREAENCRHQSIMDSCMQILEQFTPYCLATSSFLSAPHRMLQKLVECNALLCSELDLFDACLCWAKHLLAASEVEESGENLRQTLGTVLRGIRLKALTAQEFIRGPGTSGLFTQAECYQILSCICDPDNECLPADFCALPVRGTKREAIYFHGCHPGDFPHSNFQHQNTYSALCSYENLQEIQCWIVGFQIFTQDLPKTAPPESEQSYNENMSVLVFQKQDVDTGKDFKVISHYSVTNSVKYGTMINFPLPKHVNTCMHSSVNLCVTVLPHISGLYQVSPVPKLKRIYEPFVDIPMVTMYQMKGRGYVNGVAYTPRNKDRQCCKHAIYPE